MVKQRIGSRAQVMHGTAKMTGGGLKKKDLKYNKHGKIVSKKASRSAKKSKNLIKAGYITRKGHFGAIKKGGAGTINYTTGVFTLGIALLATFSNIIFLMLKGNNKTSLNKINLLFSRVLFFMTIGVAGRMHQDAISELINSTTGTLMDKNIGTSLLTSNKVSVGGLIDFGMNHGFHELSDNPLFYQSFITIVVYYVFNVFTDKISATLTAMTTTTALSVLVERTGQTNNIAEGICEVNGLNLTNVSNKFEFKGLSFNPSAPFNVNYKHISGILDPTKFNNINKNNYEYIIFVILISYNIGRMTVVKKIMSAAGDKIGLKDTLRNLLKIYDYVVKGGNKIVDVTTKKSLLVIDKVFEALVGTKLAKVTNILLRIGANFGKSSLYNSIHFILLSYIFVLPILYITDTIVGTTSMGMSGGANLSEKLDIREYAINIKELTKGLIETARGLVKGGEQLLVSKGHLLDRMSNKGDITEVMKLLNIIKRNFGMIESRLNIQDSPLLKIQNGRKLSKLLNKLN